MHLIQPFSRVWFFLLEISWQFPDSTFVSVGSWVNLLLSVSASLYHLLVHCYIDAVANVEDQCKLPQKRSGAFYIFAFYWWICCSFSCDFYLKYLRFYQIRWRKWFRLWIKHWKQIIWEKCIANHRKKIDTTIIWSEFGPSRAWSIRSFQT